MRISIDARGLNWYNGTGIGTYTKNIIKELLSLDESSANFYSLYWSGLHFEEFKKQNSKLIFSSRKHHNFFEEEYIPASLARDAIEIYHIPQNGIGLSSNIPCKTVVTIHDLIPYTMPETVGRGYLLKFLKDIPIIIGAAQGIITVSEFSKQDILRLFPINEDKIFVTPLAADEKYHKMDKEYCREYVKSNYNIIGDFIMYLGGFSKRKNVRSLILAFKHTKDHFDKEHKLVIIGEDRDDLPKLKDMVKSLELESSVFFTGFVKESELPIFYNASEIFVYPSLYEGFGLPPLEAMSCGTPVISSKVSSIPEVVGDAGILIDPNSTEYLEDALLTLSNSEKLKENYSHLGIERAKLFTWKETARKTLEVYKKVAENQ